MIRFDYSDIPRQEVLCIDVKSFFSSVESVKRGIHPLDSYIVVMSNQESAGGLVLAAAPRVKQEYGIKTGSRRFEIPINSKIKIVKPRMGLYIKVNKLINDILRSYVADEDWLPYSIDESFICITASKRLFGSAYEIAQKIQLEIWQKLRLVVTIGIGDNPLMAKICLDNASKHQANGIAQWCYEDIEKTFWKIPKLTDFWGIGNKTARSLESIGINSIYRLSQANLSTLKRRYGIIGEQMFYHAHGIDFTNLSEKYIPKSISFSKSQILKRDYIQKNEIEIVIREMADQVALTLRNRNKEAGTVHLWVGYSKDVVDKGISRQMAIYPSNSSASVIAACLKIFRDQYENQPVRSIAISCSKITDKSMLQLNLFQQAEETINQENLEMTIDKIRDRFGYPSLVHASSLLSGGTQIERSSLLGGHKA